MAITIATRSGSEQDTYDRFCVGLPVELLYDVTFGGNVTGELINLNFWIWGELLEIPINTPPPFAIVKPGIGYNIICAGAGSYIEVPIASVHAWRKSWMNVTVAIRFVTTSTAIIRLRFMHTFQHKWWINQLAPSPNFKRLFWSEVDEAIEYDIDPDSFYNMTNVSKYIGVSVQQYTPGSLPGTWDFVEEDQHADWRAWGWWWNQVAPDISTYPYTPVISYEWEFTRNAIPVSTLSLTADTDVLFRITCHPDTEFTDDYIVALVKIVPIPDSTDQFWLESPVAEGDVTATNAFGSYVSWFPHQLNSADIVTTCDVFAETGVGTDIWECTFTVPKEVVDPGCTYRVCVIIKNEFTGEPL
jgi:hypothetical protein